MHITLQAKLLPTEEQAQLLTATQRRYVELCNYLSELVHRTHITNAHTMYFRLNQEMVSRFPDMLTHFHNVARTKVAGAYRTLRTKAKLQRHSTKPKYKRFRPRRPKSCVFRPTTSVDYNKHLYSVSKSVFDKMEAENAHRLRKIKTSDARYTTIKLSIATIAGRIKVDALIPNAVLNKCWGPWKQATLVYRKESKTWYFLIAVDVQVSDEQTYERYLGVDMGITNVATLSTGEINTGIPIDIKRTKHYELVRKLQKRKTRSAKRHLIKIRKRMSHFIRTFNHTISKLIVTAAQRTGSCIVLEDLKYLHETLKARKPQRLRMFGWSYAQLRDFIVYKAKLLGIRVMMIDPKYSSQTCSECGHVERANRHGEDFECVVCGHRAHADVNAAINIATLGMLADHFKSLDMEAPAFSK